MDIDHSRMNILDRIRGSVDWVVTVRKSVLFSIPVFVWKHSVPGNWYGYNNHLKEQYPRTWWNLTMFGVTVLFVLWLLPYLSPDTETSKRIRDIYFQQCNVNTQMKRDIYRTKQSKQHIVWHIVWPKTDWKRRKPTMDATCIFTDMEMKLNFKVHIL